MCFRHLRFPTVLIGLTEYLSETTLVGVPLQRPDLDCVGPQAGLSNVRVELSQWVLSDRASVGQQSGFNLTETKIASIIAFASPEAFLLLNLSSRVLTPRLASASSSLS